MTDKDSNPDDKKEETSVGDENETHDPSRRNFIKNTSMVVGGVAGGSILGGLLTNSFKTKPTPIPAPKAVETKTAKSFMEARMFFTRFEDFVVLEQATERIFPEDDNGPGAIGLGVPYFIDKQLAGPWGINGKDYRQGPFPNLDPPTDLSRQTRGEIFLNGLRKMNELSQNKFKTTFDKAEEEQQIEILQTFESGEADMKGVNASSFFMLLRQATIEGAYSDPLYGGNKNMEGWKMKEFPGPVPSYADMIEQEEFIKMDPISLTDYHQKS